MKKVVGTLLLCLALAAAVAGQTTVTQTLFTNSATAAGQSAQIRNINQTTHWLVYCSTGTQPTGTISIELDGSFDGTSYTTASRVASLPITQTCGLLQASGYYPFLRAQYSGQAGAGATFSIWYSGSIGAVSLPTNVGQNAPDSIITTQQPPNFNVGVNTKSAATSLGLVGPATIYSGYVFNPNGSAVFVGLSFLANCTAVGSNAGCMQIVVQVPANSGVALPVPAIGIGQGTNNQWYAYCSTALASLVDPTSNCFVAVNFKQTVGVAPN